MAKKPADPNSAHSKAKERKLKNMRERTLKNTLGKRGEAGKRTEVKDSHDRYANREGVNQPAARIVRANIDDAFTRRLR
jgi:hypothetical protein